MFLLTNYCLPPNYLQFVSRRLTAALFGSYSADMNTLAGCGKTGDFAKIRNSYYAEIDVSRLQGCVGEA